MDILIQRAKELANLQVTRYTPIQNRVAYVVSHGQSYASNGYAIRTQGIANALNEHGFETLCFVRQGRPWDLAPAATTDFEVSVDGVRYLHSPWGDTNPADEVARLELAVKRLVELFLVYRPAAVLAASNFIVGLPAWVAAKQLGLPFYNEVRGFWELSRDAREPGYSTTAKFQLEANRDIFVAKQALTVFTLNQLMKAELVKRGVAADIIELVPNGVSKLPKINPDNTELKKKLGITDTDKVIGYIGSQSSYEGIDTLIEACGLLVKEGLAIKLLLVGDNQPITLKIDTKIQHAKFHWLIQTGRVEHAEVADYYALIDTVVIPRKKHAVCELVPPMKIVEALAHKKPLVVSNIPPLLDYAFEFDSISSFEVDNVDSLAIALKRSFSSPVLNPSSELQFSVTCRTMFDTLKRKCKLSLPKVELFGQEQLKKPTKSEFESKTSISVKVESELPLVNETVHIAPTHITLEGNSKKSVIDTIDVPLIGGTIELTATVVYRLTTNIKSRKAVLLFDFFDKEGNKISTIPGVGVASAFKQHFRYLDANGDTLDAKMQEVFKLKLPKEVASISLSVASLSIKENELIEVYIQGRCFNEKAEQERKQQSLQRQPMPKAIVHDPQQKRYTSDLTVACILDEFTTECLSYEVNLVKVTQENWQSQIEQKLPDFLLVESCWKGNNGNWGTLTKGSGGAKKLSGLLSYCKKNSIPTVFWNKEDPPHYEKFGPIARLFDLVITTDINMVPHYKKDFGINVYPLSFAAQPKIHNPEIVIPRLPKAVFAGSYYGDKPKRCEDFNAVMHQLELITLGYDIYDRNYQNGIKKFAFPDQYQSNIVGNLKPEDVWKAHKGYKYQVNMNTVQDSATMFARRVYESLASGTPIISNASVGVRELFGDIVIMPGEQSISQQLKALEASPAAYDELARRGVRAVMREHTYGHRIQAICGLLAIDVEVELPKVTLAITASSEGDIEKAKQLFSVQTAKNKHLFIELENFDTAYTFLNASDDTVTYSMKLARDFYAEDEQFYGCNKVLKHDLNKALAYEALEDFLYWGADGVNSSLQKAMNKVVGDL